MGEHSHPSAPTENSQKVVLENRTAKIEIEGKNKINLKRKVKIKGKGKRSLKN